MSKVLSTSTKEKIKEILEKSIDLLKDSKFEDDQTLVNQSKALLRFINKSTICKTAINVLLPSLRHRFRLEVPNNETLIDYEILLSDINAILDEYPEPIIRFDEIPANIWIYNCIVGENEYSGILCADDDFHATDAVMKKYGDKTEYISVCRAIKDKNFSEKNPNILELSISRNDA